MLPQTPRDLAKHHLRQYVLRGDPYEWLRGNSGSSGPFGDLEINGDHIIIWRIGPYTGDTRSKKPLAKFGLHAIYEEVKAELAAQTTQPSLWEAEAQL